MITYFLEVAQEREVEGGLILSDMGQGCPFRAGTFDGAISISALQWLCNADKSTHKPVQRLYKFFSTLYACLVSNFCSSRFKYLKYYTLRLDQRELFYNFIPRIVPKWSW